jgi:arsenate reductase
MTGRPAVLFLCTGNSCRSQMAEGWARALHGETLVAHSAGVAPKGLDPRAVAVMREAGVDISTQRSEHLDAFDPGALDLVVTVCGHAHETCPVLPARTRVLHRGFDDPPALARDLQDEDEVLAAYRRVRDEIRTFVATLPALLDHAPENESGEARP